MRSKLFLLSVISLCLFTACSKDDEPENTDKVKVHEYVDLGLSVKWATCNIGADSPLDFGDHFSWGAITSIEQDKHCSDPIGSTSIMEIAGTQYDAAHMLWGGTWRMPTDTEMSELIDNCQWEVSVVGDVITYKVTGPNGNFIYLPGAGAKWDDLNPDWVPGKNGYYWTSTRMSFDVGNSWGLYLEEGGRGMTGWNIEDGFSIRPVTE